jgi:hypothetical protein
MAELQRVPSGTVDAAIEPMNTRSKLGSWALSAALALGCSQTVREPSAFEQQHSNQAPVAKAGAEEAQPLTPASLTLSPPEQLVRSLCGREQQCGRIGPDEAYSSGTDCLNRVQSDWQSPLSARQCSRGVNEAGLGRCLRFVRVQDCQDRYIEATLDNQCRPDQICLDQP